jgi:hypothetical protein
MSSISVSSGSGYLPPVNAPQSAPTTAANADLGVNAAPTQSSQAAIVNANAAASASAPQPSVVPAAPSGAGSNVDIYA